MNFLLIAAYFLLSLTSLLIIHPIRSYLRNKPLDRQTLRDRVQSDLAASVLAQTFYTSAMMITKQFLPPLDHTLVLDGVLIVNIVLYYLVLIYCVAFQVFQFLFLFYDHLMQDLNESVVNLVCRIVCISSAVSISSIACHLGEATCHRSSLLLYLTEDQGPPDKRTIKSLVPLTFFMMAIVSIQITIEIKRILGRINDAKIDGLAMNAAKSIEIATSTLKCQILKSNNTSSTIPALKEAWSEGVAVIQGKKH